MTKQYNWAPVIPLIGGFALGAFEAIKQKPQAIYSYTPFTKNDSHIVNYWNDVPYIQLDVDGEVIEKQKLDFVVCLPPCAALSQLNSGTRPEVRGGCAAQNEWMFQSAQDAIDNFDPEVIITENAPALYTTKGEPVVEKLREIAAANGRSLTLYKTSTHFHGVPQRRDRTFFFLWKSKAAPILEYFDKPHKPFEDYLKEVTDVMPLQDVVINEKVKNEPYFTYIRDELGIDPRASMIEAGINTAAQYVHRNGHLDDFIRWAHETNNELGIKIGEHAKYKFSIGKGVWDGSAHVFDQRMNACIGRNMCDTVHPTEDRSLTVREALHMMAFPHDFNMERPKQTFNHIAQNVPVCTAADMVRMAVKFMEGELEMSESDFVKQNNWKQKIDFESESEIETVDIFNV